MKKLLSIGFALFTLLFLNSCLKDKGFENGEYGINPTAVNAEPFVQILGGGIAKFSNSIIVRDVSDSLNIADTLSFKVFYVNNGKPSDKDVQVTLAVNPSALSAYNAVTGNNQYTLLPDSTYSIPKKTVTVKAGQSFSEDVLVIYNPQRINDTIFYMLPISIVDAQGVKISSNNGTIYFNKKAIKPNPLRGDYSVVGLRYNYTGTVAFNGNAANIPTPGSTTLIPTLKTANAIDGNTVDMDFSNLGSQTSFNFRYVITQVNNFSSISVNYNTEFTSQNSAIKTYVTGYVSPIGQKAKFRIITHYNNAAGGGGNDRIIDEQFTQL